MNPAFRRIDYSWDNLVDFLSDYRPKFFYHTVSWELPSVGYLKCNTDGASKGNPGPAHMVSVLWITRGTCAMLKLGL